MSEGKVQFAGMGYGRIGKRHAEMIHQHPEALLNAVIDADQQKAGQRTPFFSKLEDAVTTCAIDVVNIATPNGLHAQHAIKALSLGKHVVIEKPMALSTGDAQKIVERAKEAGKYVFVVMQNRYSPVIRWLKEVMDSGVMGKLFIVQVNCLWNRNESYYQQSNWHGKKNLDGGTIFTQFSHFIDLLHWLFGDMKNIQSRFYNHNHKDYTEFEDSGFVSFDFNNGGAGSFQFTTSVWEKSLESTVTIVAENGSIKIGGQYMNQLEFCHIKNYSLPDIKKYEIGSNVTSNHYYLIDEVVWAVQNKQTHSYTNRDEIRVVDIIERIYKSVP